MVSVKLGCTALAVTVPIGVLLRGYAIQQLWAWFVVPLGAVAISMPLALGVSALVYLLTWHGGPTLWDKQHGDKSAAETMMRGSIMTIVNPLAALAVGWFYTWWL